MPYLIFWLNIAIVIDSMIDQYLIIDKIII